MVYKLLSTTNNISTNQPSHAVNFINNNHKLRNVLHYLSLYIDNDNVFFMTGESTTLTIRPLLVVSLSMTTT